MFKSKLSWALGLAAMVAASSASAVGTGVQFKVDEGVVPGILLPAIRTADSIDYSYSAHISQQVDGDGLLNFTAGDTFSETGSFSASGFKLGASAVPSSLNADPLLGGYGIIGQFSATGIAGVAGTGIKAIFSSFTLSLYIDHDQDGVGDLLLGTGNMNAFSEANIFGGLANGDFDVRMLFTPTAFGNTYFIDPTPFTLNMETTGVTTTITGAALGAFEADVDGSGNLFVNPIPEPSTLALAGLALACVGLSRRRRS